MTRNSPMNRLRRANPVLDGSSPKGAKAWHRLGRTLLAFVGIFAIGIGAAWAAGGENPVASIFKKDIRIVESDSGLDSFSILKPMTQEEFDALLRDLALRVHFAAVSHTLQKNLAEGKKPFANRVHSRSSKFRPVPAAISSIGHATASTGSEATVMVMNGEICYYFDRGRGPGGCGSLEDVATGEPSGGGYGEDRHPNLWRLAGVVPDQVASIVIEGTNRPPLEIQDNVYDIRNLKSDKNLRLIGLDEEGNEVFRSGVPIRAWSEMGE